VQLSPLQLTIVPISPSLCTFPLLLTLPGLLAGGVAVDREEDVRSAINPRKYKESGEAQDESATAHPSSPQLRMTNEKEILCAQICLV
jgi:hypothetical protein